MAEPTSTVFKVKPSACAPGSEASGQRPHQRLATPKPGQVRWTGGFWRERQQLCRQAVLPTIERAMEDRTSQVGARLRNFRILAGLEPAEPALPDQPWGSDWSDGDVYKWFEAVIRDLVLKPDPERARQVDQIVTWIATAQESDGYLHTPIQLTPGRARWNLAIDHELYNFGHLFTLGVLHHRLIGGSRMLDVAIRAADHVAKMFRELPAEHAATLQNNPSHMMGLIELYEATNDRRYLDLVDFFLGLGLTEDVTGEVSTIRAFRDEELGLGHAVFAGYRLCGAADYYTHVGEPELLTACERIWHHIATSQSYITGGTGAYPKGISPHNTVVAEAFGRPYDLPHRSAYNESCANIAYAMFSWRMLQIKGEARYADAVEQVMYNSGLSGLQLDGQAFHYINPLSWERHHVPPHPHAKWYYTRSRWSTRSCFCCPPQIARFLMWSQEWAYSIDTQSIWVHQFGSSRCQAELDAGSIFLTQETEYPWNGLVKLRVEEAPGALWSLRLRIPGWATGTTIRVNGKATDTIHEGGSYLELTRCWQRGDTIELDLAMPVEVVEAHPDVEQTRGQFAVMRGPIVYCLESVDLPDGTRIDQVSLPRDASFDRLAGEGVLRGLTLLETKLSLRASGDWGGRLYRKVTPEPPRSCVARFVPYFAWNNRGEPDMRVWLPGA